MSISFIGFGNMATAIAGGIIKNGVAKPEEMFACDLEKSKVDALGLNYLPSVKDAAAAAKFVFLCVKPQQLGDVLKKIAPVLEPRQVLVSIAAGFTVEQISEATGGICPVVRTLPNLPLMAGIGTTAIARPEGISDEDYSEIFGIFDALGSAVEIAPDKFNEVIPVSSSSPAFIFEMAELTARYAEKYGIDRQDAISLFAGTMIGCAEMLLSSGKTPTELSAMVCSKKGATIAALDAMRAGGIEEAYEAGFDRCIERAYELGRE